MSEKPKQCPVCFQYDECDLTIHRLIEDGILDKWLKSKVRLIDTAPTGLPKKTFLYTIPQIADILSVSYMGVKVYIWYEGKDKHAWENKLLRAVNIAPNKSGKPCWRIEEEELTRWMRFRKLRYYTL